jgi:hypothetical protein
MWPRARSAFKHLQQQQQQRQRQGGDDFTDNEQTMKLKRQRQRHSLALDEHKGAGESASLAAAAECSHRLLHLSHNIIKPDSPLPAFRAVGVGGVEVAQLHLHALTQHIATWRAPTPIAAASSSPSALPPSPSSSSDSFSRAQRYRPAAPCLSTPQRSTRGVAPRNNAAQVAKAMNLFQKTNEM